jgi:NAD(P)-dependent dehydrogenase (short-subunit alcohol dehydrogenase family)
MREQSLVADMSDVGFGRIVNMALRAALGKELRTAYSASKESRRSDRRDAAGSRPGDVVERAPPHPGLAKTPSFTHRRFSPFEYHM